MSTVYLSGKEPLVQGICRAAFPSYAGHSFRLETHETISIRSCWDGGSRDTFAFVDLATLSQVVAVPTNGNGFDPSFRDAEAFPMRSGIACVRHTIFCGKDLGLTIIVHPSDLNAGLLPARVELSQAERIVLAATAGLKASYGGVKDFRFHEAHNETGIARADWDVAKDALIARKLLNSAGAITTDGKNAIGSLRLHDRSLRVPGFVHRFDPKSDAGRISTVVLIVAFTIQAGLYALMLLNGFDPIMSAFHQFTR